MERSTASFLALSSARVSLSTFKTRCIPPLRSSPRLMRLLIGKRQARETTTTAKTMNIRLRRSALMCRLSYLRSFGCCLRMTSPFRFGHNFRFDGIRFDRGNGLPVKLNAGMLIHPDHHGLVLDNDDRAVNAGGRDHFVVLL